MNKNIISNLRKNHIFKALKEDEVLADPFRQFEKWFDEALNTEGPEANAVFLGTCSLKGIPSVRTVLLKHFDERGFVFYTNYSSRKGNDLKENPNASLLFYWKELGRQIRIEGVAEKVTREESEEYFNTRPFESRISALASRQSTILRNRDELEKKFEELKQKYEGGIVPLPKTWGGYRLIPGKIEFWQGRQNRLHDRILFSYEKDKWIINRLSP